MKTSAKKITKTQVAKRWIALNPNKEPNQHCTNMNILDSWWDIRNQDKTPLKFMRRNYFRQPSDKWLESVSDFIINENYKIQICPDCSHTFDDCECCEDDGTPIRNRP